MTGIFELPIRIKLQPSISLAFVILIMHIGAISGLIYTALPAWVKISIALLIILNLIHIYCVYIWQGADSSPTGLYLDNRDAWWLTFKNGETVKFNLLSGSFVHPLLIILRFSNGINRPVVILTPDVINNDQLRKLRVRLRFRR